MCLYNFPRRLKIQLEFFLDTWRGSGEEGNPQSSVWANDGETAPGRGLAGLITCVRTPQPLGSKIGTFC